MPFHGTGPVRRSAELDRPELNVSKTGRVRSQCSACTAGRIFLEHGGYTWSRRCEDCLGTGARWIDAS